MDYPGIGVGPSCAGIASGYCNFIPRDWTLVSSHNNSRRTCAFRTSVRETSFLTALWGPSSRGTAADTPEHTQAQAQAQMEQEEQQEEEQEEEA